MLGPFGFPNSSPEQYKILNDTEITERVLNENMIMPFFNERKVSKNGISYGLAPASYDFRLDHNFKKFRGACLDPVGNNNHGVYNNVVASKKGSLVLSCQDVILGRTVEEINLPDDVIGLCFLKSTWSRTGLLMNSNYINPGWSGHLTLELVNAAYYSIVLWAGEGIVSIIFAKIKKPSVSYNGFYQNQENVQELKTKKNDT